MYLQQYLSNVRLDLYVAAYSKVNRNWQDADFTPSYNKLYFILEGEGYVKLEDRTFHPKAGELYLLPAGIRQSYGTINDNGFGKYWCHFGAKLGDLHLLHIVKPSPFIAMSDRETVRGLFEELITHSTRPGLTSAFRIQTALLQLITLYLEESETVQIDLQAGGALEKMDRALKYIDEHLHTEITVDRLAQMAHFHPNYFISLFKKCTGFSPIQYINRLRIERARHLLTFTETPVASIAESVGMELPYFSRTFREQTGFAPSRYREMSRQTDQG